MGKQSDKKKKKKIGEKSGKIGDVSPKMYDKDTAVFISMSQELKEEGNKLFQKRDHDGALLIYQKSIKLLPRNHVDVSYLRSNIATCYMQMGLAEYPKAIHECNLALEVTPNYSKALLKRAKCYEGLNRLDLALRDVTTVLNIDPNNTMALEVSQRVRKTIEDKGLRVNDTVIELPSDYAEPPSTSNMPKSSRVKTRKKKKNGKLERVEEKQVDEKLEEKKAEDKVVVEERVCIKNDEELKKTVKLVFGEDIRWGQLPLNCSLCQVRQVIHDRFPSSRDVLIKYRDQEGDLVTITTDEELRWAESMAESQNSIRLYIVEVNPAEDMFLDRLTHESNGSVSENVCKGKEIKKGSYYIDDWIVEFGKLFKSQVGLDPDAYMNLHELGIKTYSEAMEETVASEEAQGLFDTAANKFQEMSALALFNWGNVHMSRARKKVSFPKKASRESVLEKTNAGYEWAQNEYTSAGDRYGEALKIKPDFYEGFLALGQQQFYKAKLLWYYSISNNGNKETWPSTDVFNLYNSAEENTAKGMHMWEKLQGQQMREISKSGNAKLKMQSKKMELDDLFVEVSSEEAAEQVKNVRSQINLLWGTILYERSLMEFKLEVPVWKKCLQVAVEKFELAGASPTDVAVIIKNHSSNNHGAEGLGFKIDEIVEAWNDMHEAKKFQSPIRSFRLESLLRRRVSKIYHAFEHA